MSRMHEDARLYLVVANPVRLDIGCRPAHDFDRHGGSIGSGEATWRLSDAFGWVAPRHAELFVLDSAFCLRDVVGMTWVNGAEAPLGKGRVVALRDGDIVRIGSFTINVALADGAGSDEGADERVSHSLSDLFAAEQAAWWQHGTPLVPAEEVMPELGDMFQDLSLTGSAVGPQFVESLCALDGPLSRLEPMGSSSKAVQTPTETNVGHDESSSNPAAPIAAGTEHGSPRAR